MDIKLTHEEIMALPEKWYVVSTIPEYENIVKDSLEKVVEKNGLQDRILEVNIPMEDVVEEKNGKRRVVQRKKISRYVMLKMRYANDLWHLVTNIRGVTSFVGPLGRPEALSDEEVARLKLEKPIVKLDFLIGDKIKVIDGSFEGMVGDIVDLDAHNFKCKVNVSMFGRIIPVELELSQIAKLN